MVDMSVHELLHQHHRVSRALLESRFPPANNLNLADESWTHVRDGGLMRPLR